MCQGCTLDQSVASGTGGAVYLDSAASITLEDMSITNSHAASGGAYFSTGGVRWCAMQPTLLC